MPVTVGRERRDFPPALIEMVFLAGLLHAPTRVSATDWALALKPLTPAERMVTIYRVFFEMDLKSIGEIMGVSGSRTQQRWASALRRLKIEGKCQGILS